MAPRKKSSVKSALVGKAHKAAKKTTRSAAKAASVSRDHKYHTYTDHRSDSYRHYASIMKTVILFLGFVLLLAILANIFAPGIGTRQGVLHSSNTNSNQNFLDTRESGYRAASPNNGSYQQYKYTVPEGADGTASATIDSSGISTESAH